EFQQQYNHNNMKEITIPELHIFNIKVCYLHGAIILQYLALIYDDYLDIFSLCAYQFFLLNLFEHNTLDYSLDLLFHHNYRTAVPLCDDVSVVHSIWHYITLNTTIYLKLAVLDMGLQILRWASLWSKALLHVCTGKDNKESKMTLIITANKFVFFCLINLW
ncbi:hypothetical protein ACJX0J_039716, partial [Zea mays]